MLVEEDSPSSPSIKFTLLTVAMYVSTISGIIQTPKSILIFVNGINMVNI